MGKGGGGGGGQPQTTTAYQTNLPEYAKPYVMNMLGAAQNQLFETTGGEITGFRPYTPYSTDPTKYFAGPSSLQQSVYNEAGQMQTPGQFGAATGLAGASGMGQLGTTQQAQGLGAAGMGIGQLGLAGAMPAFGAGQQYAQQVTSPSSMAAYMSPYQQQVTDVAKAAAVREAQMADQAARLGSARQGTYGGARQTLARAERERNLLSNLSNIQAQGSQAAYDKAMQAQQFGANLGLQGIQTGLQGVQAGMQGVGQGLQGVGAQQAGYAGAGQAASTLGQLGGAAQQADLARLGFQQQTGQQQQAYQQNIINQAIQDYATAQQYPLMQLSAMSSLLRGLPLQSATTQTYQAAPSVTSQIAGLGTAGIGAYGLGKAAGVFKAGGKVQAYKYGGAIPSDKLEAMANKLSKDQLEAQLRDPSLDDVERQIFAAELKERMQANPIGTGIAALPAGNMDNLGMAGGGIIAFNGEGESLVKKKIDPVKYDFSNQLGYGEFPIESYKYDPETSPIRMAQKERAANEAKTSGLTNSVLNFLLPGREGYTVPPKDTAAVTPVKVNPKTGAPDKTNAAPAAGTTALTTETEKELEKGLGALSTTAGKYEKDIQRLMGELNTGLKEGRAQSDLDELREQIKERQGEKLWTSLIRGGLRAAAGKSQYALQNIAEGAESGLDAYAKAEEAERADKKLLIAQQSALEQAEYARKTGNLNALIQAQTRLDNVNLQTMALKLQRAGITDQRLQTAITARAKLILGNNAMPTPSEVDDAITAATNQVMGKSTSTASVPQGVTVRKVNKG